MSTSGATNPGFPDGKISVTKPDLFYSERNKINNWIMQLPSLLSIPTRDEAA